MDKKTKKALWITGLILAGVFIFYALGGFGNTFSVLSLHSFSSRTVNPVSDMTEKSLYNLSFTLEQPVNRNFADCSSPLESGVIVQLDPDVDAFDMDIQGPGDNVYLKTGIHPKFPTNSIFNKKFPSENTVFNGIKSVSFPLGDDSKELIVVPDNQTFFCEARTTANADYFACDYYLKVHSIDPDTGEIVRGCYYSYDGGSFLMPVYKQGFEPVPMISIYRFENNQCASLTIPSLSRTNNDYDNLADCQAKIVTQQNNQSQGNQTGNQNQENIPTISVIWYVLGIAVFVGVLIFIYLKTRR